MLTSTALRDRANYLQFPDCNGDSDHNPIVAAINTRSLTLTPPPPPPPELPDQPKSPRFKIPMNVEELAKFREVLSLTAGQEINAIGLALSSLRQSADQTCKDDLDIPSKEKLAPFNTQLQQIEEDLADLMSTTILPIAKENLSMTSPTTQTQKHHRPRGLQRKIVKRARTARWLRKAVYTYDDYMESRSTLPQSTDIATELTKHQDFDPPHHAKPASRSPTRRWWAVRGMARLER